MEAETTESVAPMSEICGICKEIFLDKEPQLLSCLHSFCKSCLKNCESQTQENDSENAGKLTCPLCKQVCNKKEVIDNKFVGDDKKQNQGELEENNHVCTACEENATATSYCAECSEWLCDQCVTAHRRVRMTKDHTIHPKDEVVENSDSSLLEKVFMCPVHKQEPLKLYCETCDKLTCRDCQLLEHKEHKYSFVDEYCKQYRPFLKTLLDKISEKRTYIENAKTLIKKRFGDIKDRETKVGNDVKLFAIKFISEINRRGKELLSDLSAVSSAKRKQLEQKHKEILALSEKLDHVMLFTQQVLNNKSSMALLYSKSLMINQLRTVLRTRCEVPNPSHHIDIKFAYDGNFLKNCIPRLGALLVDGVTYGKSSAPPNPKPTITPQSAALNFNQLTPEQQYLVQRCMSKQHQNQSMSSAHSNPASSPSAWASQSSQSTVTMNNGSGGPNLPNQKLLGAKAALQNKLQNQNHRNPRQRPILPRPMYPETVRQNLTTVASMPSTPSTGPTASAQISSTTVLQPRRPVFPAVSSCTSSTGDPKHPDLSIPSSTDSSSTTATTPQVKQEPGTAAGDLTPGAFSFDTDPVSLFTNIKPEVQNSEAEISNRSRTPPLSPGSSNQDTYNLSEPTTEQVMGGYLRQSSTHDPSDPNADYCACCHNGGDLLCCDTCPNVFHYKCHVPELNTAPTGNWSCGLCIKESDLVLEAPESRTKTLTADRKRKIPMGLSEKEIRVCERILLELFCHDASTAFHEPVSKAIPNYHKIVNNPMDFLTIKCKLMPKHFNHYETIDDFVSDVRLVFINCAKYNSCQGDENMQKTGADLSVTVDEFSVVGKAGHAVEKFFESLLHCYIPYYVYTWSNEVRDTGTPNSERSDKDGRPSKRKKKGEDVIHIT